jgi:hypothetical protein
MVEYSQAIKTMAQKDYALIAGVIKAIGNKKSEPKFNNTQLTCIVEHFEFALLKENPSFDIEKFENSIYDA